MKKILLSMLLMCSLVLFAGCNHKQDAVNEQQRTDNVPIEQQEFYSQEMPDGHETVVIEEETVEEVPLEQ